MAHAKRVAELHFTIKPPFCSTKGFLVRGAGENNEHEEQANHIRQNESFKIYTWPQVYALLHGTQSTTRKLKIPMVDGFVVFP